MNPEACSQANWGTYSRIRRARKDAALNAPGFTSRGRRFSDSPFLKQAQAPSGPSASESRKLALAVLFIEFLILGSASARGAAPAERPVAISFRSQESNFTAQNIEATLAQGRADSATKFDSAFKLTAVSLLALGTDRAAEEGVSILSFGAKCDGKADDTQSISAALTSGARVVVIPSGTCNITSLRVPAGVTILGLSSLSSCLVEISSTATAVILGHSSRVEDLCIYSTRSDATGTFFLILGNQAQVRNVYGKGYFIFAQAGTQTVQAINPQFLNVNLTNPSTRLGAAAIELVNYSNAVIFDVVAAGPSSGTQPSYGIRILNGDTAFIENVNITLHGRALAIDPLDRQNTFATLVQNGVFDSAGSDAAGAVPSCEINPSGSGGVHETVMSNVWCGLASSADGLLVHSDAGSVDGLHIANIMAVGNHGNGIHLGDNVTNMTIHGGIAGGNGLNGLFISGAISHLSVSNLDARPDSARKNQANGRFGINIGSANSDFVEISESDVTGNLAGGLSYSSKGQHNEIRNVVGYNPVGAKQIALTGNACEIYRSGPSPENVIVAGGQVRSISIQGVDLGMTSGVLPLVPNSTVQICSFSPPKVTSLVQ